MATTLRIILTVTGVVAIVVGAVFSGQGLGLIPGSFMTGDRTWLVIGLVVVFVGVALVLFGTNRRRPPAR